MALGVGCPQSPAGGPLHRQLRAYQLAPLSSAGEENECGWGHMYIDTVLLIMGGTASLLPCNKITSDSPSHFIYSHVQTREEVPLFHPYPKDFP